MSKTQIVTGGLDQTGSFDFTSGVTLGDNLLFDASSKGIYLGVTSATAANLLDDYEEGTHSPTVTGDGGGTATLDSGSNTLAYTKVGRTVHLTGTIYVTSVSGCSGAMRMSLPFTCLANSNGTGFHGVMVPLFSVNAAGDLGVAFQLEPNAASGLFFGVNDNSSSSNQLSTGYYRITLTYQTN